MPIVDTRGLNRRCRRLLTSRHRQCGADFESIRLLMIQYSWHLDQHSARYATRHRLDSDSGVPASAAVIPPIYPTYHWHTLNIDHSLFQAASNRIWPPHSAASFLRSFIP